MSSLAATQADGYYLPPEYYESGAKSKNEWYAKQQGRKATTSSAPVVRFELADPCVCNCCHARIGRGTRFNATKHATSETYFSTAIWEFRTKCRRCGEAEFVIRTDPKNRGFSYGGNLRRQERNWDAKEVGGITVEQTTHDDDEDDPDEDASPLNRLEKQAWGLKNAVTERKQLEQLIQLNQETVGDDATGNARLRASFRKDRQSRKRLRQHAAQKGWKESVRMVETSVEDTSYAKSTVFGNGKKNENKRWKRVRQASIFDATAMVPTRPDKPVSLTSSIVVKAETPKSCANRPNDTPQPRRKRQLLVIHGREGVSKTAYQEKEKESMQNQREQSALQSIAEGYGSSDDDSS